MTDQLGIIDLLNAFGFDQHLKTKLVRHRSAKYSIPDLYRDGWFEFYQSVQSKTVFQRTEQLVSFIGEAGTHARFVGLYKVADVEPLQEKHFPKGCPYGQWLGPNVKYFYRLDEQPQFRDLKDRVVIDWGLSTRSWHQRLTNKRVLEVSAPGRKLHPFTDYLDFDLSHEELKMLVASPQAHRDWSSALRAVAGVYLILARNSGDLYIGSATGGEGIWGRWSSYARTGHGGNKRLIQLIDEDTRYPSGFRYSILQVLPKSTTRREVIRWESRFKEKLGSRAIGLNIN